MEGRVKSLFRVKSLNYDENVKELSDLFQKINNANDAEIQAAIEEINKQKSPKSPQSSKSKSNASLNVVGSEANDITRSIEELKAHLRLQLRHIETVRYKKGIDVKDLAKINLKSQPHGHAAKKILNPEGDIAQFFTKNQEFRETTIKGVLEKQNELFNRGFDDTEVQMITSFLMAHADVQDLLNELENNNSLPLQLALIQGLPSIQEDNVDKFRNLIANFKSPISTNEPPKNPLSINNMGMIFGDSFIRDSGLEGDNRYAYVKLINNYFKDTGLDKTADIKPIQQMLENCVSLDGKDTPTELKAKIKEALSKSNNVPPKCILMGGWMQHGIVYEVEKQKNGKLTFRIYNEGEGIQYHDQIQEKYKTKYAGCIAIKDITEKRLLKKGFLANLQSITQLSYDPETDAHSNKIVPMKFLIENMLPTLDGTRETIDDRVQQFLSPQRSGTCTYRSVLAFLAHSMPFEEYKLFKLNLKIYALKNYLNQLKEINDHQSISNYNYEDYLLKQSVIQRSIEKFASGIKKLEGRVPPENINEAREIIQQYTGELGELKKLEKNIKIYEKSLHTQSLTRLEEPVDHFDAPPINLQTTGVASVGGDLQTQYSSHSISWIQCKKVLRIIEEIPSDKNSAEFSEKVENCLHHLVSLNYGQVEENDSLYVISEFFKKLNDIQAWNSVKFDDPVSAQLNLKKLSNVCMTHIGTIVKENVNKPEWICSYFTFEYALERTSVQIPIMLRVVELPKSAVLNLHNMFLLKTLRVSDPFWVDYINKITSSFFKKPINTIPIDFIQEKSLQLDIPIFNEQISGQISTWMRADENAALLQFVKTSVQQDREVQAQKIEEVKKEIIMKKINLEARIKEKQKEIKSSNKLLLQSKDEGFKESLRRNLDKQSHDLQILNLQLDYLGTKEQHEINNVWEDPQYWPKDMDFKNDANLESRQAEGLFLFLHNPSFIKNKFDQTKIRTQSDQVLAQRLSQIHQRGDILPEEFRISINHHILCDKFIFKSSNIVIDSLEFTSEPSNGKSSQSDKFNFSQDNTVLAQDIYVKNIEKPEIEAIYKTLIKNSGIYDETYVPKLSQEFNLTNPGLERDKVAEIYSSKVNDNIKIDALLNYFQENLHDLHDSDWLSLFHSYLFESNLLLKELQNPKSCEILLPKIQKLFQKGIENSIGLERFDTAANLSWMASNVQKYIDYVSDQRVKRGQSALPKIINENQIFEIIDKVSDQKYSTQLAVVYEASLAAFANMVNPQKLVANNEITKKIIGNTIFFNIMRNRLQLTPEMQPRKKDAENFLIFMNHILSETPSTSLTVIVDQFVAPKLGFVYPHLKGLKFEFQDRDIFKTRNGISIGLMDGQISSTDPKVLDIYDQPLNTASLQFLITNKLYSKEEAKDLVCYMVGNEVNILDKKNNRELIFNASSLKVKFPWSKGAFLEYIKIDDRETGSVYLDKKFHLFEYKDQVFLCELENFEPAYVGTLPDPALRTPTTRKINLRKIDSNLAVAAKVVNQSKTEKLFSNFEDVNNIFFLADDQDRIKEIDLPRLDLKFKLSNDQWESSQHPGWVLDKEQYAPHFGQKTGFLVLKKGDAKKVLLPVWKFNDSEKKRSLNYPVTYQFNPEEASGRYIECDIVDSRMVPNSLEARYYLAHIFLEKGKLDEAEKLLSVIEANPTHRALSNNERSVLKDIVLSKRSSDIGSRTIRLQLRAAYLLERNQNQFLKGVKSNDSEIASNSEYSNKKNILLKEYLERLGHLNPLDETEETLLLETALQSYIYMGKSVPDYLSIRMRELNLLEDSSVFSEPRTVKPSPIEYHSKLSGNQEAPNINIKVSFKNSYKYYKCRLQNTFPFDPKNPDETQIMENLQLMMQECRKGMSFEKATKNGMLQTLQALSFWDQSKPGEHSYYTVRINYCMSKIVQPKASTHAKLAGNKITLRKPSQLKTYVPENDVHSKKEVKGTQPLIVLKELQYTQGEKDFLPNLAQAFLDTQQSPPKSINDIFVTNSPEQVDKTSKSLFKHFKEELSHAQKTQQDVNFSLKRDKEYAGLREQIDQKILDCSANLAAHERIMVGAMSTALRSNAQSDFSFASKARSIPSISEMCILCAKSDGGTSLKQQFPELDDEGIANLKNAAKSYLIEKQFLQHLKRTQNCLREIDKALLASPRNPETMRILEDTLGRSMVAERAYDLENPNAMIFLQLETLLDIKFRSDQVTNINKFIEGFKEDQEVVLQMIMGAGKTSVLQPLLAFLLSDPSKNLSTIMVPEALYEPVRDNLVKLLGEGFNRCVVTIEYNRDLAKNEAYLSSFLKTIKVAKEQGSVLLLTPHQKESILTSLSETFTVPNGSDSKIETRKKLIKEICSYLALNEATQVDEIDMVYNPQVIFKYPIGGRSLVNPERASLLSSIIISMANDKEICDTVSLDFVNKFNERRGIPPSERAAAINENLYRDVIRPKLAAIAIENMKKINGRVKVFALMDKENYISHFIMNSTPFDEQIQSLCLPKEEIAIALKLKNLKAINSDEFNALLLSNSNSIESLIAKKIDFSSKRDSWINDKFKDQGDRDLLGVCGIAITKVLTKSLDKACGSNYGLDPMGAPVSRPYNAPDNPKKTVFGTSEEQIIYSTQQVLYYGIPEDAAGKILAGSQNAARNEMKVNKIPLVETDAYQEILAMFGESLKNYSFLETPPSEKFLKEFIEKANKNEKMISQYLQVYVYPKIAEYGKSLSCTPQALANSSKLQCGYTGTLHQGVLSRTQEATPEIGTDGRTILAVQAQMESGKAVTEVFPTGGGKSPAKMMHDKFLTDHDLFVYIDSGEWLKEENIDDFALKLLQDCREKRPDIEGIVYHDKQGVIMCLERDPLSNTFNTIPLQHSRLKTNEGKTLTIIGRIYETGTNIPQKANAKAYMSVRKDMVLRDGLQSIFRMRQILLNQSVSFALTDEVSDSIAAGVLNGLFGTKEIKDIFTNENLNNPASLANVLKELQLNQQLINVLMSTFQSMTNTLNKGKVWTQKELINEFTIIFKQKFPEIASSDYVWRYFVVNQARVEQEKNWLTGKQKMKEVIEKPIRMALCDPNLTPRAQDEIFKRFESLLVETQNLSPYKNFTSVGGYVDSQAAIDLEVERYEKFLKILVEFNNSKDLELKAAAMQIFKNMEKLYLKTESDKPNCYNIIIEVLKVLSNCVKADDIPPIILASDLDQGNELEQEAEQELEHEQTVEKQIEVQVAVIPGNLQKKGYTPIIRNSGNTFLNTSSFNYSPALLPLQQVVPDVMQRLIGELNVRCSTNLFIDGAALTSNKHGEYYIPGKYVLAISSPNRATEYIYISHQDFSSLKDEILNAPIQSPGGISILSFDGSVSACTNPELANNIANQDQFKKIALLGKLMSGKVSYASSELKLLKMMLTESGKFKEQARELNKVLISVVQHLPSSAREYGNSGIRKLLDVAA